MKKKNMAATGVANFSYVKSILILSISENFKKCVSLALLVSRKWYYFNGSYMNIKIGIKMNFLTHRAILTHMHVFCKQ